ncbi:MAG: hypothetical protein BMS9Abin29_2391 [Gemmatimonadota bacterium]|nr:MAG: hypothetical protein BMS9Abin29_2391 [Gemmatimonadota bacterium]
MQLSTGLTFASSRSLHPCPPHSNFQTWEQNAIGG